MQLKDKYTWMKHIDFILIDLISLVIAFVLAYYNRFSKLDMFQDQEWSSLFVIICSINLIVSFCLSPYSGVLKRRYYQQFHKEVLLFIYQIFITFAIFYALKIGAIFSRKMMFTMYAYYFVISQTSKYINKKIVAKKYSRKKQKELSEDENVSKGIRDLITKNEKSEIKNIIYLFIKRIVDIIGGIVGCILLIPLTIIVFILNKLNEEDDGPVFYVQERIGKNGVPFNMFKFRSMVVDADEKLERFLEENEDVREEFMMYRKIKNDPRITKVGKFLRKTSLDEFPQFINVLMGDMSLVGPRPYLEREFPDMRGYYDLIVKYKPGVTGLWQISGRSDVRFSERLDIDIEYHKNHSIFLDIKILIKTVGLVLVKKGAM